MIGIFSRYGINISFQDRIKSIKKAGFEATSIFFDQEEKMIMDKKENDMPTIIRDSGLFLESVHAPYESCNLLWSPIKNESEKIKNIYTAYMLYCSKHKIPILVIHISLGYTIHKINYSGINLLKNIVNIAKDLNVNIAIENTRVPQLLDEIFSEINSNNLRFCFDSSHDFLYSSPPYKILKKHKDRLISVHLSDNDGRTDLHWIPGEGIINWPILLDHFPKNYSGVFNLETFPKNNESNHIFLKKAYRSIKMIENNFRMMKLI